MFEWVSHVKFQLNNAERAFYALKIGITFNPLWRTKLNLSGSSGALHPCLWRSSAWFPDNARLKKNWNVSRNPVSAGFLVIDRAMKSNLKNLIFFPICHSSTFVMLANIIEGRFKYDCSTYQFQKNVSEEIRTGVTSGLNCRHSTLSHQKVFFIRSAEVVNYLFRHNIIDCIDNENMKIFENFVC